MQRVMYFWIMMEFQKLAYKIVINGGSIFAYDVNEGQSGFSSNITVVNNITIYGHLDYNYVDFACYISKDSRKVTNLTILKPDEKTLTIKTNDNKIDFSNMNAIHFGNSKK